MSEEKLNNNEEGYISFGDIFSWIWKKKILGLIVCLGVAVVAFVAILIVNTRIEKYTANFDYGTTPNLEDGTHLDGTNFNYLNLVSEDTLNSVKESSEAYNSIDIQDLLLSIEITRTYVYDSQNEETVRDTYYTLTVNSSCFASEEQAKAFIIDLVNTPLEYDRNIINSVNFNTISGYVENSNTFEEQIRYLSTQIDALDNGYDDLISRFGNISLYLENDENGNLVMADASSSATTNMTISQIRSIFNGNLSDYNYSYLTDIATANAYVKTDADNKATYYTKLYQQRIDALVLRNTRLQAQIDELDTQIDKFLNNNGQLIDTSALASLYSERSSLQTQATSNQNSIDEMQKVIDYIAVEEAKGEAGFAEDNAFKEDLDELYDYIQSATITYTSLYQNLYTRLLEVNYRNASVIVTDGNISIIINIAVSVVLGLLVGCVVAGIVGYSSTKKTKETKENPVEEKVTE